MADLIAKIVISNIQEKSINIKSNSGSLKQREQKKLYEKYTSCLNEELIDPNLPQLQCYNHLNKHKKI